MLRIFIQVKCAKEAIEEEIATEEAQAKRAAEEDKKAAEKAKAEEAKKADKEAKAPGDGTPVLLTKSKKSDRPEEVSYRDFK